MAHMRPESLNVRIVARTGAASSSPQTAQLTDVDAQNVESKVQAWFRLFFLRNDVTKGAHVTVEIDSD